MSLRVEIKQLHSPDVANLMTYVPEDAGTSGFSFRSWPSRLTEAEKNRLTLSCVQRAGSAIISGRKESSLDATTLWSIPTITRSWRDFFGTTLINAQEARGK